MTNIIKTTIVSYKEKIKGSDPFSCILARTEIIVDVLRRRMKIQEAAEKHRAHRNTITNILTLFKTNITSKYQRLLLGGTSFDKEDLLDHFNGLKQISRVPKRHLKMATLEQENAIAKLHKKRGYGVGRMKTHIRRTLAGADRRSSIVKEFKSVENLTRAQLKGIYKRKKLKPPTRQTGSKQRRRLYDYDSIAVFENLHYDTKTITDLKSLPLDIYNKFKNHPELPVIEWNIMDAASRFRFIAWSHGRTSEFGFHFLVCVLQFIRGMFPCMRDRPINIGADNGSEFCLGSKEKLNNWNKSLKFLNANFWVYHPNWDIRKNLIERSHRSDDEEFYVPKGPFIKNKKTFLKEARNYFLYFNAARPHSGLSMNGKTPIEKLESRGLKNAEKLLTFPTMILEDTIATIRKNTEIVQMAAEIDRQMEQKKYLDQKTIAKIRTNYGDFFSQGYAQNVLTYYLLPIFFI
jgi:hypothetical protein